MYVLLYSSVISLATRCAMPSFRMHLRARGKVAQVFKTLNDAPQHPVKIKTNQRHQEFSLLQMEVAKITGEQHEDQ